MMDIKKQLDSWSFQSVQWLLSAERLESSSFPTHFYAFQQWVADIKPFSDRCFKLFCMSFVTELTYNWIYMAWYVKHYDLNNIYVIILFSVSASDITLENCFYFVTFKSQPQIKGKESENSYQELKRSPKDRHTQTHGNCIEIFRQARPSFSIRRE